MGLDKIGPLILVCILPAISAAQLQAVSQDASPVGKIPGAQPAAIDALPANAIFLFGRANYFKALTKQLRCDLLDESLFKATNDRFEAVRVRLASRYGEKLFPPNKPVGAPLRQGTCDRETLLSYANHVAEVEHYLDQTS